MVGDGMPHKSIGQKLLAKCYFPKDEKHYYVDFAYIRDGRTRICKRAACFASFRNDSGYISMAAVSWINFFTRSGRGERWRPKAVRMFDYIFNRSIYKDVFILPSEDIEDNLVLHYIDTQKHDSGVVAGALVAARNIWEYPYTAETFCQLVDMGVDEHIAFVMSGLFSKSSIAKEWTTHKPSSNHSLLDVYELCIEGITKLLCNGYKKDIWEPFSVVQKGKGEWSFGIWTRMKQEYDGEVVNFISEWVDGVKTRFGTKEGVGFAAVTTLSDESIINISKELSEIAYGKN